MNPNQLYYVSQPGGTQQGPWTAAVIASMVQRGQLPANSLVWTEGMADWQPVSSIMGCVPCSSAYAGSWNPIVAFKTCLKRYCQFSGRASRSEYWFFYLANTMIALALQIFGMLFAMLPPDLFAAASLLLLVGSFMLSLALLLPGLAAAVRRLHDAGKSGWWWFIFFVPFIGWIWLLVLLCTQSDGPNRYGAGPAGPLS